MIRRYGSALVFCFAVAAAVPTTSASAKSPAAKVDRRQEDALVYLERPVFYRPSGYAWSFGESSSRAEFNGRPFGYGHRPDGWTNYLR